MNKKFILIGAIAFILIALAITTFLIKQQQDNRQRASGTETPTVTNTPTPTPTMLDSEEWNFLKLINDYRVTFGLSPLKVSLKLTEAAKWKSQDMVTTGVLDHVDSQGRNINTRLPAFGYNAPHIAENIAWVGGTGQAAFDAWKNGCDADSSGNCTYAHREQMKDPQATAIGIGRAQASTNWYWTTDFGSVLDQEITPTPTPSITSTPTASPSATVTTITTPSTTDSPTSTSTPTATSTPTNTPTSTPTRTPTPTPTRTPTPTSTGTPVPTATNTPIPTFAATAVPTATLTSTPTWTPTVATTATNIPPTATPTIAKPGGLSQTIGIIGGALIIIIGGVFLLLL